MSDLEAQIATARAGDHNEFSRLAEPYRRELQVHCYRITGSLQDAEDLVQETLLRAWRRLDTFEGRAPLRAWLYKIATNACLDALDKRPRRSLPTRRSSASDPRAPFVQPRAEPIWIEPLPDNLIAEASESPEARYSIRESVTLAFLVALQNLPPRQRAVVILRDVLDWQASEVAGLLDMTIPAVNSALHRARATLEQNYHRKGSATVQRASVDSRLNALLDRYLRAWENADVASLTALLKEDATLSMPPSPSWYLGRNAIRVFLKSAIFGSSFFPGEGQGRWRLLPTRANAQPAFGAYLRGSPGVHEAFGILSPIFDGKRLAEIITFINPALVVRFGLPDRLIA